MTNHSTAKNIGRSLLLVMGLLLSACDGGIFGTGGPDDIDMSTVNAGAPIVDGQTGGTDGSVTGNSENDTTTDSGIATENSDAGTTAATSGSSDSGDMSGFTDAGGTDAGSTDSGAGTDTPALGSSQFTNNQATLDTADIKVNLINASSVPVNAIESAVTNSPVLFGDDGVALNTLSSSATLQLNNTSINIVNNRNQAEILFSFPSINVLDATFTTLLVRENGEQIDAVALSTLTKTADAMLAKVRVVQADALDNATAEAMFQLQSAGENPGGIDDSFGPLSFAAPVSNYADIPSGDYELIDSLGRIENQPLTFVGGNVYTIVILGDSAEPLLLINDTQSGE